MPKTDFNTTTALSGEAREAVDAAFDAMSTWREEMIRNNDKNIEKVIRQVADAAKALGWPRQIVDATRQQMQTVSEMQTQTMDNMFAAWQEQIKSPNQPSALLSKLNSLSGFGSATGANGGMNPFGMYMEFTKQWQKAWADGLSFWSQAGKGLGT
jgi:hypothetical protein